MASRRIAVSVSEDVAERIDREATRRGMTRSQFVARVLGQVARAQTDAEIVRRINRVVSDPEVDREQIDTARAYEAITSAAGREW